MATPRLSILDKIRNKLKTKKGTAAYQADSFKWYREQITKLGPANQTSLLADKKRSEDGLVPGFMYLFRYDPKHKKALPYYDRFPLIFPVEMTEDGFYGINFHYLNYRMRLALFHELETLADKSPKDPRARIRTSYQMLKGMARFRAFKPCFKRYLGNHVKSHFIKIEAPDWETALFLPVENFAKHPKTYVWKESEEKINTVSSNGLPKNG